MEKWTGPHEWITTVEDFDRNTDWKNGKGTNPIRKKADRPGCYAFCLTDECLCVGSSICSVKQRVMHHIRYNPFDYSDRSDKSQVALHEAIIEARERKKTVYIRFWTCAAKQARIKESLLIQVLTPRFNTYVKLHHVKNPEQGE